MDHARPRSRRQAIQRIALIAALTLLFIGGGVTLAGIDFSTYRVERDTVSIETVRRGRLEIKVSANGRLLARNVEQLGSQVTARVARVLVRPGDVVKAGQLLVELASPELVASAEQAYSAWEGAVTELHSSEVELQTNLLNQEGVLTQAEFNLEKARLQLEAETKLIDERIISEIEYKSTRLEVAQLARLHEIEEGRLEKTRDNIKVLLAVRKARVTELARALDRARTQAANLKVLAGIDGIVQAINVDVGQQLQPGSPIGHIAQQDELYAELRVAAREASGVQTGQHAIIDTRSGTVAGVVSRIDPGVTDGTVIVDVDLDGEVPPGARPQLQVEGIVYVSQLADALYVGKPAYVKSNASISVYKLDAANRYATRVQIRAGEVSLNHLQVVEGLRAGDRIITSEIDGWQNHERILLD